MGTTIHFENLIQKDAVLEVMLGQSKKWITVLIDDVEKNHVTLRQHMYHSAFSKHRFHKRHLKDYRTPVLH